MYYEPDILIIVRIVNRIGISGCASGVSESFCVNFVTIVGEKAPIFNLKSVTYLTKANTNHAWVLVAIFLWLRYYLIFSICSLR